MHMHTREIQYWATSKPGVHDSRGQGWSWVEAALTARIFARAGASPCPGRVRTRPAGRLEPCDVIRALPTPIALPPGIMQRRRQHELPWLHPRSMSGAARSRTAFCGADSASLARDSQIVTFAMAPKKRSPAQLAAAARGIAAKKLRAASTTSSVTAVEPGAHRLPLRRLPPASPLMPIVFRHRHCLAMGRCHIIIAMGSSFSAANGCSDAPGRV